MTTSGRKRAASATTPSIDNRTIAKAAASAFGGRPNVDRYWDDNHQQSVDVLSCQDAPWAGVTSYATIGLSDTPIVKDGAPLGIRVEFVGACGSQVDTFGRYLATAAFCVMNSGWFVAPGIVFPNVLSMFDASPTMRHVLFLPPFLWNEQLETLVLEKKRVAWLLAVPVSEAELRFAEAKGVGALENVFEEHQIDIFDINRKSVV
ncbi:MAG TPA: suppressor of fused domain protein [Polyangiaceae bacterium]|jgi:hypothetical protein|nr:suppressor of fused domain protein [Polyangiaceae bacterium]